MKKLVLAPTIIAGGVIAITAAFGMTLHAQDNASSASSASQKPDTSFITNAAMANLAEVELGKLGAQKAQNEDLKKLSEHIQKDHSAANEKLQPIAQKQGITLPETLDRRHEQAKTKLQDLSGPEFDKAFATVLLRDHARSIALFQREAQMGQDPEIKDYAKSTLPTLKQHMKSAQKAATDVGVDQTTISSIMREHPEASGGTGTPDSSEKGTSGKQDKEQK
jgi:putative membrane protein